VLAVLAVLGPRGQPPTAAGRVRARACARLRATARGARCARVTGAKRTSGPETLSEAKDARSLDCSCARPARPGAPARGARVATKESVMLRIYPVLLELVRSLGPLVKQLERHDPDLAKQCRKALSSAPLNVAEAT